ncbi:MAG TPA: DUF420 domain-containing protein [Vicinamibacterales bacterium]
MGPDPVSALPALNATLNAVAAVLLVIGYVQIRQRRWRAHRAVMLAAFSTSVLFLISYVIYHANAGSRPFQGQGAIRIVYFAILITHVILAAAIVPLALVTLWRGLRGSGDPEGSPYVKGSPRNPRHAKIARWTLPIWLYVSVTGVVVYLMLYRM